MLYSLKVFGTSNIGDNSCSPFSYFDLGKPIEVDIQACTTQFTKEDVVIIGGGGLLNYDDNWNKTINRVIRTAGKAIIWGAGQNTHYGKVIHEALDVANALAGIRMYGAGNRYLPCPSCMHRLFESVQTSNKNAPLLIKHLWTDIDEAHVNIVSNDCGFNTVITKIANASGVISQSFHGIYWSLLLGKKVVAYRPFSNRFHDFRVEVPIASTLEEANDILDKMEAPGLGYLRRAVVLIVSSIKRL